MHPFTNASVADFEMTTPSCNSNSHLFAPQNMAYVQPSSWVTTATPVKQEIFSPASLVERHELIRNGLLPQLDRMQLMHMPVDCKRTKLELTPEEEQKRRVRREKNKVAAAKCRTKNREFSKNLKKDHETLEKQQVELREQLSSLRADVQRLEGLLASHNCVLNEEQRKEIEERLERVSDIDSAQWVEGLLREGDGVGETKLSVLSSGEKVESDADTIINSGMSSPATEG